MYATIAYYEGFRNQYALAEHSIVKFPSAMTAGRFMIHSSP